MAQVVITWPVEYMPKLARVEIANVEMRRSDTISPPSNPVSSKSLAAPGSRGP